MKCWFPAPGKWSLAALLLCLPLVPCLAQENARTVKTTDSQLYCSNESGKMRCIRKPKPRQTRATVPAPMEAAVAAPAPSAQSEQPSASVKVPAPAAFTVVLSAAQNTAPLPIFVEVNVHGRRVDEFARILQVGADRFYATAEQFARWRLKPPTAEPMRLEGVSYYPLHTNGITSYLDPKEQVLFIQPSPAQFMDTVLNLHAHRGAEPMTPEPGLFLNHDFQGTYARGDWSVAGLAEVGFFSKAGTLTTRLVSRDLTRSGRPYRLDTQFIRDFPRRMATLTIGDATSAPAGWARQVHYGGIRWASKFSTQPGFLPFALPALSGEAAQPSTVDIYVNSVRTATRQVDAGPFSIQNVPIMSSQGDIQMVVTDVLGRQQVVTQSYISSAQLLRKGVSEYTYEAGSLRKGFGSAEARYDSFFLGGTHRLGVTDLFTLNLRGEIAREFQTLGVGGDYGLLHLGLVGGGAAVSRGRHGVGALVHSYIQHRARSFGAAISAQMATRNFRQLGLGVQEQTPRLTAQLQISRAMSNRGSIAAGVLHRQYWEPSVLSSFDRPKKEFSAFTASTGLRLWGGAFLSISGNYSPTIRKSISGAVTLIVPLGNRKHMVVNSDLQRGGASTVEVSQQLPVGSGYGYRLRSSLRDTDRSDAGLFLQNGQGRYGLEASRNHGGTSFRLSETGGIVWMRNRVLLSRWLDDSFALVEVPGSRGVTVLANNQSVARTGRQGVALVPRLVAYDRNTIALDDSGVPLEFGMDMVEKTVVPMPRSGVYVRFAASKIEGALFQLVREDGTPLPLGAEVKVNGGPEVFQVALRGEVFVTALTFPATLTAQWSNRTCRVSVPRAPEGQTLPRIGPLVCKVRP